MSKTMAFSEYHFPFGVRVFVSIYLSILLLLGIVGNGLVCAIFILRRKLRTSINMIVFSLAVADILQSFNMIIMVVCVNQGKWVFGYTFSQISGFVTIAFVVTSLLHLFLISLNRYIMICLKKHKHLLSKKIAFIGISLAWIYPALLAICPILGWAKYEYRPAKLMCTVRFNTDLSYTIILIASALLIPLIGLIYCYMKIMKVIIRNRRRIAKVDTIVGGDRRKEEIRIAIILGVVVFSFILFYAPAGIANLWEMTVGPSYVMPIYFDLVSVLLAMLNHANNPFIYGFMNKQFRETLMDWFNIPYNSKERNGTIRTGLKSLPPLPEARGKHTEGDSLPQLERGKSDPKLPQKFALTRCKCKKDDRSSQRSDQFVSRDARVAGH